MFAPPFTPKLNCAVAANEKRIEIAISENNFVSIKIDFKKFAN
jgi:hypothetical protein